MAESSSQDTASKESLRGGWPWGLIALQFLASPAAAPKGARASDRSEHEETLRSMGTLMDALFGTGDGIGYIRDMGGLPSSLLDLVPATGSPAASTGDAGQVAMGYHGPYLRRAGGTSQARLDGGSTPIAIVSSGGTVPLESAEPERDPMTTSDSLLYPVVVRATQGTAEVLPFGVPSSGGSATALTSAVLDVSVYVASHSVQSSSAASEVSADIFQTSGIHVGQHYVTVSAQVPGAYDVSSASEMVARRGSKVTKQLRLVAKAPTTVRHKPNGNQPQTLGLPPSSVAAHLNHGDSLGSCTNDSGKGGSGNNGKHGIGNTEKN
jgi:hypothetical protein